MPRFGGRVPINAAPSLPPHNRGSLAGDTAAAPAPSPRAPPRVVFLLLLAPPIRFAVRAQLSRVPRASARRALCLRFLLASFVLVAVYPPVGLGRIGLVCPFPALSRKLVRWRGASRSPLRGCLRALPPPLPLFGSVGWASLPVGRLRRRALLRSSVGTAVCPFGAVFVPLSRGWLVFLPSVPLPRPRFAAVAPLGSRGKSALPRAALGVRPLSPI